MTVDCPLCDGPADDDAALVDHLTAVHADWGSGHRERRWSLSPGVDAGYVAQLALWAREDPDMVRRYVDALVAEHTRPDLLAMPNRAFWAYARDVILGYLTERTQ